MEDVSKKTMLALTHNFVGTGFVQRLKDNIISQGSREVHLVSAENMFTRTSDFKEGGVRERCIEMVRDPELAKNKPDILLLYVGASNPLKALMFSDLFGLDVEIHHVVSDDATKGYDDAYRSRQWGFSPIIHVSEPTGNLTMNGLIETFLKGDELAEDRL